MTYHSQPMIRAITLWLTLCAILVVSMVAIGGYTRLSGSGLSITEWKPIHGSIPPLNDAEWQEEFEKYQQIPQYRAINPDMTLAEFKQIFWPEFLHRLLGRIIGIVFIIPLIFFWINGAFSHRFGCSLLAIFSLGGLQGFMGWYMVSSGLVENIYVSHFRLAAHLALALLLLGMIMWKILSVERGAWNVEREDLHAATLPRLTFAMWFTLLCLQILYGALVAGLHAGLLYNSWPTMNGEWVPSGLSVAIFTDHTTVQFIHRMLAIFIAIGFGFWWFFSRIYVRNAGLVKLAASLACVIALQITLGVLTLVNAVPLGLGMLHQMTAVALFVLSIVLLHKVMGHGSWVMKETQQTQDS